MVQPQNRWYPSSRLRTIRRICPLFSRAPTRFYRHVLLSPNTYSCSRFLSVLRSKFSVAVVRRRALPRSMSEKNTKRSRVWRTFGLGLGAGRHLYRNRPIDWRYTDATVEQRHRYRMLGIDVVHRYLRMAAHQ